jgi:hypothetical protein
MLFKPYGSKSVIDLPVDHPVRALPFGGTGIDGFEAAFFDEVLVESARAGEFGMKTRDEDIFVFGGGDDIMRAVQQAC